MYKENKSEEAKCVGAIVAGREWLKPVWQERMVDPDPNPYRAIPADKLPISPRARNILNQCLNSTSSWYVGEQNKELVDDHAIVQNMRTALLLASLDRPPKARVKRFHELTVEDIGILLKVYDMERLVYRFQDLQIDGSSLLNHTWESLRDEVGIVQSHMRRKLLRMVTASHGFTFS